MKRDVMANSRRRWVSLAAVLCALLVLFTTPVPVHAQPAAHLLLQESGHGNRVGRSSFVVRNAPWFVSWHFNCAVVRAGHRHTVFDMLDGNLAHAEVISNGRDEGAINLEHPFRRPSDQDQALRRAWRRGTSGALTLSETGQLYSIRIVTECRWAFKVRESPPGHDPLAGTWLYLKTVPRGDVEAMGYRFRAVHVAVAISRSRALQIGRLAGGTRSPGTQHTLFAIQEIMLARLDTIDLHDGCICWVLIRRSVPPTLADIILVDANTGRWDGEATLSLGSIRPS